MSKAATRYAKSLLDLSLERGSLERIYADIKLVINVCKENRDLVNMLKSPVIRTDNKQAVLEAVFGSNVDKLTIEFMRILAVKKREDMLFEIAEAFVDQYRTHKNILTAVITTAVGLDDEMRAKVLQVVKDSAKSEVELIEKVDKNIIGGFIIRMGDKQDDTSISRKLKMLNRTFSENPYIKEF